MLSHENPSYDDERADPRLVAFARRPFKWRVADDIEIPIALIGASDQTPIGHDGLRALGLADPTTALGVGEFQGFFTWLTSPYPHRHVHVELSFMHRPLQRKVISYNEAECQSRVLASEFVYSDSSTV